MKIDLNYYEQQRYLDPHLFEGIKILLAEKEQSDVPSFKELHEESDSRDSVLRCCCGTELDD